MLTHTLVQASEAGAGAPAPTRWVIFLHGILGTGANWRTIAKRLVEADPTLGAVLVDLRMHGGSQAEVPPHTVAAAAQDLTVLEPHLPGPVTAVVGHSFGGKVALAYVLEREARGSDLARAWIIDSTPGARPEPRGSEETMAILETLGRLSPCFPDRKAFVAQVRAAGHSEALAQWLAMNLERRGDGVSLRLDLKAIRALLADYFARDLWPSVESPLGKTKLSFLVGGASRVLSSEDLERLAAAAAATPERVEVRVIEGAGHWVHVDAPDAVLDALRGTV